MAESPLSHVPPTGSLPPLPRDAEGPVFRAPWEAQAFAMAVRLHAAGHFTWPEWAARLSTEIKAAEAHGEPDTGERYYEYWLAALERLVAEKGLLAEAEMATRRNAWARAYRETPHGKPVRLGRGA